MATRMMFPGGNTAGGYHGFYEYIVPPDATRKYVIKGGPGTGKSTLMKTLGERLEQQGLAVEYHWCSSDNGSLDGLVVPDYRIAVLDGTAPHVVDPAYPGAVDQIVNLGDCWDRSLLSSARESIITTTRSISFQFQLAYSRLAEAHVAYSEWKSCVRQAKDPDRVNRVAQALEAAIDPEDTNIGSMFKVRHLFASAITPGGVVTHLKTLWPENTRVVALVGSPGCGADEIMSYLAARSEILGHVVEYFHCPLDPSALECIFLPGLALAFVNLARQVVPPLNDQVKAMADVHYVNIDNHLNQKMVSAYKDIADKARGRFLEGLIDAVARLSRAKAMHDDLETHYISAMDFAAVARTRERLFTDILALCK